MKLHHSGSIISCILGLSATAIAQSSSSCTFSLTPSYPAPSVASGYEAKLVATGLSDPRGILFDSSGNLLVVQQGKGIVAVTFTDNGGSCLGNAQTKDVVVDNSLNHGIELSADGRTLYASNSTDVFAWSYDPQAKATTSDRRRIVTGMGTTGHSTRTLLLLKKVNDTLLVSWGSQGNIDQEATDVASGVCQVKAFNLANATAPYDFASSGLRLGWGLRNSVGVGEHPITGGIYTVENSVDEMTRDGVDVHENNPGEEMNFHGYLNGTAYANQGANFGYPSCYAAWGVGDLPNNQGLQVGSNFAIGNQTATSNDTYCRDQTISPRITFTAHTAPLDIKFNANGTTAWVSFHGSWNRDEPSGYTVSAFQFANGEPVQPANSTTAQIDIVSNPDISRCPNDCFRPVGLAWDQQGRLFFSSDSTGEIYVVTATGGSSADNTAPSSDNQAAGGGSGPGSAASTLSSGSLVALLFATLCSVFTLV